MAHNVGGCTAFGSRTQLVLRQDGIMELLNAVPYAYSGRHDVSTHTLTEGSARWPPRGSMRGLSSVSSP